MEVSPLIRFSTLGQYRLPDCRREAERLLRGGGGFGYWAVGSGGWAESWFRLFFGSEGWEVGRNLGVYENGTASTSRIWDASSYWVALLWASAVLSGRAPAEENWGR